LKQYALLLQERILQCGGVAAAAAATAAAAGSPGATTDSRQPADDGSAAKQSGGSGSGTGGQQRLGAALLFFGCRRRDQDYLYGGLLQGWADAGVLELHTAFSREKVRESTMAAVHVAVQAGRLCLRMPLAANGL
jgi:hypothetical protein